MTSQINLLHKKDTLWGIALRVFVLIPDHFYDESKEANYLVFICVGVGWHFPMSKAKSNNIPAKQFDIKTHSKRQLQVIYTVCYYFCK